MRTCRTLHFCFGKQLETSFLTFGWSTEGLLSRATNNLHLKIRGNLKDSLSIREICKIK